MDLSVNRSIELLARLRDTSAAYAAREDQHAKDFAAKRHAQNRRHRDDSARADAAWNARIAEAEGVFDKETARIRTRHDARKARIQRIQAKLTRNLPQRAKDAKGKWLAKLQMKEIHAERDKDKGMEAADKSAKVFDARLDRRKTEIVSLNHGSRKLFMGYGAFSQVLDEELRAEREKPSGNPAELHIAMKAQITAADGHLTAFRKFPLPRVFGVLQLPLILPLVFGGGAVIGVALGKTPLAWGIGGAVAVVLCIVACILHATGKKQALPVVREFAIALAKATRLHEACVKAAAEHHAGERKVVDEAYQKEHKIITDKWNWAGAVESEFEKSERIKFEEQVPELLEMNEALARPKLKKVADAKAERVGRLRTEASAQMEQINAAHAKEMAVIAEQEKAHWEELEAAWKRDTADLSHAANAMNAAAQVNAWDAQTVRDWKPSMLFASSARFARLELGNDPHTVPKRLAAEAAVPTTFPVALTFPAHGSLLFETSETGTATVIDTMNNLILRILSAMPPGKAAFTIIDPVGLGQSFAGLMHLADYEEALINRRIWTQRDQIEERLSELNEHIEKVIQMYLRNEYANITQYNEQAGSVAEKYHFLVIADFPAGFTDIGVKRLQSIVASGARCGVYTFIHWDQRQPMPDGFVPDELRKHSVVIRGERGVFTLPGQHQGATLVFDPPPTDDLAQDLVHKIGKSSVDSNRVEVPFEQISPKPGELWTGDTTNELRVAIGRTGATKQQYLAIGKGTRQHALFAGKTGSGKSTLFHVIITNLALNCSPDQVEFYLIDFKKGVEFKCYASKNLPHAKVVAIESDREFGLSVLQRVDEELKRRGDMFRKLGVQDIAGYKRAGGTEPVPRALLLIDEFQEFFVEDDQIAQAASVLFDRIVRQGRAFGIHVVLGSQTLGGAYTLARATLGQMVIRVALQCNEADAHLIMDENNSAPRLLSRPGEGIYNDAAGVVEGNSPFQVVWLSDEERDRCLDRVQDLAQERGFKNKGPIVFEGNAPAEIRENFLLAAAIDSTPAKAPAAAHAWLGAPNSIKGPTEAVFRRQGGNHLLVVGQRDESVATMFGVSLLSLAAQHPPDKAKFVVLLGTNPGSADSEFIERVAAAIPHEVSIVRPHESPEAMSQLNAELQSRTSGDASDAPAIFVFIHGLHRFKKLKNEDDFDFSSSDSGPAPGAIVNSLLSEGSSHGIHLIVSVDTFANVGRFLSRKAVGEFEMRVVFQMSANDSASLIDSPRAGALGLHRALLYNEHEGTLETFRPYATPDAEWIEAALEKVKSRTPSGQPVAL